MRVQVNLKWEPVKEADLAGYKLYWGGEGIPATSWTLAKDVTSLLLVLHLAPMRYHRFFVSSYDIAGNESEKRLLTTVFVAG